MVHVADRQRQDQQAQHARERERLEHTHGHDQDHRHQHPDDAAPFFAPCNRVRGLRPFAIWGHRMPSSAHPARMLVQTALTNV